MNPVNTMNKRQNIYSNIEKLNYQIDICNFVLQESADRNKSQEFIQEIKSLHKEVRLLKMELMPKNYKSGRN